MAKDRFPLAKLIPVLPDPLVKAIGEYGDPEQLEVVRKAARGTLRLDENARTWTHYVTTRDIDRDQEIVVSKGILLDEFKLAPQVLWGHDYSAPPIGSAKEIKSDGYGIRTTTEFAETERAEEVWGLVKGGHLRTSSIGFVPLETVDRDGEGWAEIIKKLGRAWSMGAEAFETVERIISKALLLEYSIVSVPANIYTANPPEVKEHDDIETAGADLTVVETAEEDADVVEVEFIPEPVPIVVPQQRAPLPVPELCEEETVEQEINRDWREDVDKAKGRV